MARPERDEFFVGSERAWTEPARVQRDPAATTPTSPPLSHSVSPAYKTNITQFRRPIPPPPLPSSIRCRCRGTTTTTNPPMELPVGFLLNVFVRSKADELVPWSRVSRQWRGVITSRDLLLQRRRFHMSVEPLLIYHPELLFGSPTGVVECYCPSRATPAETQPTKDIVVAPSSPAELEEDTLITVLLLCGPTDLVLWRRVCRQWRAIISSPRFVRMYHQLRRAPEPMLMLCPSVPRSIRQFLAPMTPAEIAHTRTFHIQFAEQFLAPMTPAEIAHTRTFHIQFAEHIHAIPSSGPLFLMEGEQRQMNIYASVDGMLLLSYNCHLFAVNPVTHRGVRVPPIHTDAVILALFNGADPGDENPDYRILYCNREKPVGAYRTYSIATRETVRHECTAPSEAVEETLLHCMPELGCPLVVSRVVHWLQGFNTMILCFDISSSQFRLMAPPQTSGSRSTQILEVDGEIALVALGMTEPIVDLWVHQQCEWQLLYHAVLPLSEIELYCDPFDFYDYFVVSSAGDILVDTTGIILHFDCNGVLLGRYKHDGYNLTVFQHQLKRSLLPLSA